MARRGSGKYLKAGPKLGMKNPKTRRGAGSYVLGNTHGGTTLPTDKSMKRMYY